MNRQQIREAFLDLFREGKYRVGQGVIDRHLRSFVRKLPQHDVQVLGEEVDALCYDGLIIEAPHNLPLGGYLLTEKGYNEIYEVRSDFELEEEIMKHFRRIKASVGTPIKYYPLMTELQRMLNPKEFDEMGRILQQLIEKKGEISYKSEPFPILCLERNGYMRIYR